jgi:D-alanyl-lipoteichoic acid acyltransferase DltB (MBOAT superfamily)
MPFNSIPFALFLPCVLLLYHRLGRRAQNVLLILASCVFYGWWDWRFLALLLGPALVDCAAAVRIAAATTRGRCRAWLALSVGMHVGLLGFFKYFGFFAASLHDALAAVGLQVSMPSLRILLPVGISFYTFQSMSYTLDVYRGDVQARRSLPTVLLFVTYFPVLLAGPISRPSTLLPQLERDRHVGWAHAQ